MRSPWREGTHFWVWIPRPQSQDDSVRPPDRLQQAGAPAQWLGDGLIRGFVADVGCELLYRNEEPGPVEAVFVFPMYTEVAVYAFQVRLAGACIQAQLHEKKQAP
ncbi:von Willebrand factor A domain-containing protein 5A-like isoform X2 [Dermochelys coriacea]|uniref:von Willebrand factor A domain-containing protein 5A-like isoform X2 n=1 Tax=Dermochelys coriacea TaxID=27794 RepID=UPI001CA8CC57|nr:von Willebrand factor A domain-containing protein 5A-like isoform X2 [Dermochelys coriacea]